MEISSVPSITSMQDLVGFLIDNDLMESSQKGSVMLLDPIDMEIKPIKTLIHVSNDCLVLSFEPVSKIQNSLELFKDSFEELKVFEANQEANNIIRFPR